MKRLDAMTRVTLRTGHTLLAGGGHSRSLLVLIFHHVLAAADELQPDEPDAAAFAAQMDLVGDLCNVLPLSEAIDRLYAGSLPPRAACITFDDGYANNLTVAAPILAQRGLPATVFVSTGFIGNGRMWNDTVIESVRRAGDVLDLESLGLGCHPLPDMAARRRAIDAILHGLKHLDPRERMQKASGIGERVGRALPEDLMMSEAQIKALHRQGFEIGAHTVTHPILRSVARDVARREIAASKDALEAITGAPVHTFAYPNGRPHEDYDASHVRMVRECGFSAAVSTAWGVAARHTDRFQVPRLLPWDRSALKFAARLLLARRARQATSVTAD